MRTDTRQKHTTIPTTTISITETSIGKSDHCVDCRYTLGLGLGIELKTITVKLNINVCLLMHAGITYALTVFRNNSGTQQSLLHCRNSAMQPNLATASSTSENHNQCQRHLQIQSQLEH